MTLKAVLFDFNGVIINDEPLHEKLIEKILIEENLRIKPGEYREICLGRSDRACLNELLTRRGRIVTDEYLMGLIARKSRAYHRELESIEKLPIYPGLTDLIFQIRAAQLPMSIVSGAVRSEIELVLQRAQLSLYFTVIVAGDEIKASKPAPDGYLLAVERLNQQYPSLTLQPKECLVIEDTPAGIQAAKRAGMQVVGVANTYPFHMMQRQANWAVDYLSELELDRVREIFARTEPVSAECNG
ncbi:MAG: HAD family phosphatase [Cyanobacteria bacterium CRU_2_1]|nr:HAD family phosphatase [Cyanobacteria bacterium RU_5_0]NJR59473.1 HAD family phosphatase [Cyanobacteria bacterium CRU_2_1]